MTREFHPDEEALMEKLKSEYPTEEQMRELFEARKKPGAIAEILRRREQEAETANDQRAENESTRKHI